MLAFIALLCAISVPIKQNTNVNQSVKKVPNSTQSAELQSLTEERMREAERLQAFRNSEDSWNLANRWFGFGAVTLGGLLGIGAFLSQRSAARASLDQRPINARIEEIDRRSDEIRNQASQYEIAVAQQAAGAANERAGNAEKAAESEKLERLKLEAKIAPRRLTLQQQKDIGHACLGLTGKPIVVRSYSLDSEGTALAMQIASALHATGIDVRPNLASMMPLGGFSTGVVISGPPEEDAFTSCLGHALSEKGSLDVTVNGAKTIKGSIQPHSLLTAGSPIDILVGAKPIEIETMK